MEEAVAFVNWIGANADLALVIVLILCHFLLLLDFVLSRSTAHS